MSQNKISPILQSLTKETQTLNSADLAPRFESLSVVNKPNNEKFVVVFLHCNEDANFDHLLLKRIKVNQKKGKIRTAYLPVSEIETLATEGSVSYVNHSSKMQTKMDKAREAVNYQTFVNNTGFQGKGVIIGIVDTGIDVKHPAFAGRILKLWDQKLPGSGPASAPSYGMELTPALMEVSRDEDGHGTHVAGIAAGKDGQWSGIAPEADLIIVKTDFDNAHIADAVSYIFREAEALGKPAVVNLSLGGHFDAHDGSDELSQIINGEVGEGKIVCCAAGNEGERNLHAQLTLQAARTQEMEIEVGLSPYFFLNGWYPANAKVEIALLSPQGLQTPFQAVPPPGGLVVKQHQLAGTLVEVATPPLSLLNGEFNFTIFVQAPNGQLLKQGVWRLLIRTLPSSAATPLHAWIALPHEHAVSFRGVTATADHKIGSPGAANGAITVAAYATRNQLPNGRVFSFSKNEIAKFSSRGPVRGSASKPDVAAPGQFIVSALSANFNFAGQEFLVIAPKHIAMQGTSMACPLVTGIVALLLQKDPKLTPDKVKELLKTNSKVPNLVRGTHDIAWGFGLIDMQQLLANDQKEADLAGFVRFQDMNDQGVQEGVWRVSNAQTKKRKKLKGFKFEIQPAIAGLGIEYMAHLQGSGDTNWVQGGMYLGFSSSRNSRVEGFAIRLTGALASKYEVVYTARPQNIAETAPCKNGEFCGTRGESRNIEGIKVQINLK